MKGAAALLLALALFYVGGMFRSPGFLLAATALLFLALLLFLLLRLGARRIKVSVRLPQEALRRGEPFFVTMRIENPLPLPFPKAELALRCGEEDFSGTLPVPARDAAEASFSVIPRYCGAFAVQMKRLALWDLLAFWKRRLRPAFSESVIVLPDSPPLFTVVEGSPTMTAETDGAPGEGSGPPPEIREIGEYRQGDALRDIHWKLSARRDELLTKRYSRETRPRVRVVWDGAGTVSAKRADAYWSMCWSLSLGLLEAGAPHTATWFDRERFGLVDREITGRDALFAAMEERLRAKEPFGEEGLPDAALQELLDGEAAGETVVFAETELVLRTRRGELLRCSEEQYEKEIRENSIRL